MKYHQQICLRNCVHISFMSIFLNETFRMSSSLRFPDYKAILDGRGNCLMLATPIFQKHCFFKKCPKNVTNFWRFNFFFNSGCNFIGLFNDISFIFVFSVFFDVQGDLCLAKTGVVYLSLADCIMQYRNYFNF